MAHSLTDPIEFADAEHPDRYARTIAVLAVATILAAAVVGYLHTDAEKSAEAAELKAQELASQSVSEQSRARSDAYAQLDLFRRARLLESRSAVARDLESFGAGFNRAALGVERSLADRVREDVERRARDVSEGESVGGLPPLSAKGPQGPSEDLFFPSRYLSEAGAEGARLFGLSDAAAEEATGWGGQVSSYIAILALFAVALYLFSFSLTPHGRENRVLFAGTGAGLSAVAVIWALITALGAPDEPDPGAATAYSEGITAQLVDENGRAAEAYDRALELRPGFGIAQAGLASAATSDGAPDAHYADGSGISLTTPDALALAIEEREQALDLGLEDFSLLAGLGFDKTILGIQEESPGLVRAGLALSIRAAELDPEASFNTFNVGLAQLALGEVEAARETYARGAQQAVVEAREGFLGRAYPVTGALTDLEVLAAHSDEDLSDEILAVKEQLIAAHARRKPEGAPAPDDAANVEITEVEITPGWVQADIGGGDFDPRRDDVWIQWYAKQDELGWFSLSSASGTEPQIGSEGGQSFYVQRDGRGWYWRTHYLYHSSACLPEAEYRAELYVNGNLIDTRETRARLSSLEAAKDDSLQYLLCRPADWQPATERETGLFSGFVSEDGSQGIYLFRATTPSEVVDAGLDENYVDQRLSAVLEEFRSLLPGPPGELQSIGEVDAAFGGLTSPFNRDYRFPGGKIFAGAGVMVDDSVLVALVFGPNSYMNSQEAIDIFNAVTQEF